MLLAFVFVCFGGMMIGWIVALALEGQSFEGVSGYLAWFAVLGLGIIVLLLGTGVIGPQT